jgi:HEAT repeat protein
MQEKTQDLVARLRHCRTLPEIQEACSAEGRERDLIHLLIEVLGSEETSVQWKAAVALTEIGPSAVEDLIACQSDPRVCVRSSAAWILGNIGDIRAVPVLQRYLEDTSGEVRKEAAEALGKLAAARSRLGGENGTPGMSMPTG